MNERRNPRTARAPLLAVVAKEPFTFSITLKCRAEQAAGAFKWWVALRVDLSGEARIGTSLALPAALVLSR